MTKHTKDVLGDELEKVGLTDMAAKARTGYYHDFLSPLPLPEMQLLEDLTTAASGAREAKNIEQMEAIMRLRRRHMDGDFDASPEESEEWANSPEGRAAFEQLIRKCE